MDWIPEISGKLTAIILFLKTLNSSDLTRLNCLFPTMKRVSLQTHLVYSTLKRRGNGCFHVASTWNIHGAFVEYRKNKTLMYFSSQPHSLQPNLQTT